MNLVKFLVGLGSRSYVLSVLLTSIVVGASECGTVPCEGDTCETGGEEPVKAGVADAAIAVDLRRRRGEFLR